MKSVLLAGAILALASHDPLPAHGGQYRGPGDVVPPGAKPTGSPKTPGGGKGPAGPSTPGPSGPSAPGPGGPFTPGGPGQPGGGGSALTGARGVDVGDDLTRWVYWWEFHKDPYLRLKDSLSGLGPVTNPDDVFFGASTREEVRDLVAISDSDRRDRILPRLKEALDRTEQTDITSSCLVAMAKLGVERSDIQLLPECRARLRSPVQEVRETAALAMGISQLPDALEDLIALASDAPRGRELTARGEVDDRTRAFACYGIGLVAWPSSSADLKRRAHDAIADLLGDARTSSRNVQVAAINALRLLRPDDEAAREQAIVTLLAFGERDLGRGRELVQAHVPPAIAKLVGRGGDRALALAATFTAHLAAESKRAPELRQSAALALAELCSPPERDPRFADAVATLRRTSEQDKDQQTRLFALMALGQIGGAGNRTFLLKALARGHNAIEKPWAGLALGVLEFDRLEREASAATPDETIGTALARTMSAAKNPDLVASMAIALGLCRHDASADLLREQLQQLRAQEEPAGYVALGLALMGATGAAAELDDIVRSSVRKPDLLRQAAIALGKLGDRRAADTLQQMLAGEAEDQPNLAKLSAISSALGFIGDRRSIDPLIKMLFDGNLTELSRAFAAVALGGIADKEDLPWGSKIAVDLNYRAAVETLTDKKGGILDIL